MRVPGVPFDPAARTLGAMTPTGITLHRTYGRWLGDYSVGKTVPNGTGFHFLIGKAHGRVVQFADTTRRCGHAGEGVANRTHVAIEFEGRNEEPLTDWQVQLGAWIIAAVSNHHGIRRDFYNGPRRATQPGITVHASILGSDHTDTVTRADFDRMAAYWGHEPGPSAVIDYMAVRRLAAAQLLASIGDVPQLGGGDHGLHVIVVQRTLNVLGANPRVPETGRYDDDTIRAVVAFQKRHGVRDVFAGVFGAPTRYVAALALDAIVDGLA